MDGAASGGARPQPLVKASLELEDEAGRGELDIPGMVTVGADEGGGETTGEAASVEAQYQNLCRAARDGDIPTVEALLTAGVPPDLRKMNPDQDPDKKHSMSPLLWASERGQVEAIKILLNRGAKIDAVDAFQMTALHWAAARGHIEAVCLLVSSGAWLNATEQDNMTPLHLAATQGQTECVLTLLKLGANPDAEGKENWPPILWAAHKGNADVVEVLCTASGHTRRHMQQALHLACEMGHTEVVSKLIKAGVSLNQPGPDRMSPVHRATLKGHTDVVKLLLSRGARLSPFRKDKHNLNHTPLHWAAAKGNIEICEALLEAGQEVNMVDKRNWTALHWAVEKGHANVVTLLLKYGADVNSTDKDNRTPLRFAAVQGYTEVLSELVAAGANLNARDKTQMTPLHWSAKKGRAEILGKLIAAGANPVLLDKDNKRAADLARAAGLTELASKLDAATEAYLAKYPKAVEEAEKEIAQLESEENSKRRVVRAEKEPQAREQENQRDPGANRASPVGRDTHQVGQAGAKQLSDEDGDGAQMKGCFCFRF